MGFNESIRNIKSDVETYVDAKIEEVELSTVEKSVHVAANTFGWLIIGLLSMFCFALITVVLIVFLQQVTGSFLTSVATVGVGFLVILMLASIFFKKLLYKPIKNLLYGLYFETKEDLS